MNLIEGSALAVEYLNYGGDVAEALDKSVEPYRSAWMAYRQKGGSDAKVYAMLCTGSLRYGSIDPIYSDHYPHPSEIFSYLLNFIQHFESIANDRDSNSQILPLLRHPAITTNLVQYVQANPKTSLTIPRP